MSDLISRQAAIRWVKTECNPYGKPTLDFESGKKVIEHLEQMPPAQPEIIRCKDCRHGVDYYHEGDCYCSNPKWGLKYFGGSWEFYCADAERSE